MKQEKTTGAKIRAFDTRADYARILSQREAEQPPRNPVFAGGWYVVAVGETLPPESEKMLFATDQTADGRGSETESARTFESYGDALKWMVENCEIPALDFGAIPRGFERPRFPRVCYLRKYTEVETL